MIFTFLPSLRAWKGILVIIVRYGNRSVVVLLLWMTRNYEKSLTFSVKSTKLPTRNRALKQ